MNRPRRAITVVWLLPVLWCCGGCTGPDTDAGHPSDVQAEVALDAAAGDRSALSSDGIATDDTGGENLLDVESYRHPQQCDPEAWLQYQYENAWTRYSEIRNPPEAGPPPYDATCRPAVDRACQTICDCKFAFVSDACLVIGVNVAVPWNHWPFLGKNPDTGLCDLGIGCYFTLPLEERTLDCVDGSCVALGKGADEEMEAMLEFQATTQVRHLTPEEYTNEPIPVGQAGMHFQCDGLLGPVQVVTGDERCAVLHGIVGDVLLIDEAKVFDVSEDFELDGIKLVWSEQEFPLVEEEILFGNQAAVGVPVRSRGFCPRVLVESSNTLFEADFDPALGCIIPFIVDGVTYVTYISLSACTPWQMEPGDEVYLFVRFNEEDGKSYVISPFFVEDGQVDSPCCPVPTSNPQQFEDTLMALLAAETE